MAARELLSKPRIHWPIIKICFEVYHALRPFHRHNDSLYKSSKRTIVFLFFVGLRWFFFLRRLVRDKTALNRPMSIRERATLLTAICGHILMIWAQDVTLKHEKESGPEKVGEKTVNERGPYSIVRHPHHIGKWVSEAFVAVYQSNKVSMAISVATLGLTVNRANREEEGYLRDEEHLRYKRKVPNKLVPGIY